MNFPRLREDLVFSRQETAAGVMFVVKDPLIGRFVRFKEPEYFIARQLDGETPLEEIRRRGEKEFGATLAESTLEGFAKKLQALGFLENGKGSTLAPPTTTTLSPSDGEREQKAVRGEKKEPRIRGNIFYLRFKVLDPDRFLAWLAPKVSFIYTRTFAWLSVGLMLAGVWVAIASWEELHHSFPRLLRVEAVALAWVTLVGMVVGHEFSHGLTCKYFGGKVHEIGMLLIYLQPAMYCNVSDAWLFPQKSKRMLVMLAGAWFDLLGWALATLLWRITEPSTLLNFLALVVATTLGIKSLFNLNPLIKLDGYYLLSDWVEIPNLRRKAFGHMGSCLRKLWAWRKSGAGEAPALPRERRIFWAYGILAAVYSTWLIGWMLLSLGQFMFARYQGWGFVCFVALLLVVFRNSLISAAKTVTSHLTPSQGTLRMVKRLARMLMVLGAASACLYFIRTESKVSGEFTILPMRNAEVRAELEGIIQELPHGEGDAVKAGDLIARLSDRDYRAELEKVRADLAEKGARLKLLKAGARPEELELARTTVTKGEERLKYAGVYLEMEKKLYEEKLSSKKDFEVAEELVSLRQKEIEESKGNLKLLLAGSRPEEIEATEAELSRLGAQQRYLEEQLRLLRVASPIDGIVTTHRLEEKLGSTVKKGDLVAVVQELHTVSAEISVQEKEISEVKIGQRVVLKARAHLNQSFEGKVFAIAPVATKSAEGIAQRNFLVMTKLDNSEGLLKGEMSGNAKIYCGERRLYEIVFRRLIRFVRVEFWSWW